MGYKIENIEVNGEVYELPTKTSDLINDSEFQTKSNVEELIANIKIDTGIPIRNNTSNTADIEPNVLNVWGEMITLNITLAPPTDESIVNEYLIQFTSGATATQLTLPSDIAWTTDPIIEPNTTYIISIVNNIGVIGGA